MRALGLVVLLLAGCGDDAAPADGASDPGDLAAGVDGVQPAADLASPPDLAPYGDPLAGAPAVTLVPGAGSYGFTEGPVWLAASARLLFSDIDASQILALVPPSALSLLRGDSGEANGNAVDAMGRLVTCEGGRHRVTRTLTDGSIELLAERTGGKLFNSPNDVIVRADGNLYFTDPNYGGRDPADHPPVEGVYRRDPSGNVTLVDGTLMRPNGIALSPDGKILYVADEPRDLVQRYDVATDGSVSGGQKLVDTANGPDGMAIDDAGNLYLATAAGIEVRRPDGSLRGTLAVPEQPANCTFGGADRRTLYITARHGLYQVALAVPGLP